MMKSDLFLFRKD